MNKSPDYLEGYMWGYEDGLKHAQTMIQDAISRHQVVGLTEQEKMDRLRLMTEHVGSQRGASEAELGYYDERRVQRVRAAAEGEG